MNRTPNKHDLNNHQRGSGVICNGNSYWIEELVGGYMSELTHSESCESQILKALDQISYKTKPHDIQKIFGTISRLFHNIVVIDLGYPEAVFRNLDNRTQEDSFLPKIDIDIDLSIIPSNYHQKIYAQWLLDGITYQSGLFADSCGESNLDGMLRSTAILQHLGAQLAHVNIMNGSDENLSDIMKNISL